MRTQANRITAGVICALLLTATGMGTWNAHRVVPAATPTIGTLSKPAAVPALDWPAQGVAAIGAQGFGVLATHGDQTARPIASISKVITSLAVLEKSPLQLGEQGPLYTVTQADVARYNDYVARDGSVALVAVGEQISEYKALQAMLLPSANNVADSLAVWVFGSLENYHAYANQMVQRLGMTHTTVGGDASGMLPITTSTPADLVKLGETALGNQVIAQIVAQPTAELPVAGTVYNTNLLLGQEGVIGIKTGTSDEAGGCLLSAATHEVTKGKTVTVISAVLGAPDRPAVRAAAAALLDSAKTNFTYETPISSGQLIATYSLPWGATATAVADSSVAFIRWNGDPIQSAPKLDTIARGMPKGAKLGTLTVSSGTARYTATVITRQAVAGPSLWWRATRRD